MNNCKPTCDLVTWRQRQLLQQRVRGFFMERGVLEVETPVLSGACGTDPHLDYFETQVFIDGGPHSQTGEPRYLMTSPEFHMKRLLAAGFGDCYQIARAFRNGERGARHNCEFSMVEWYRLDWKLEELLVEVEELVSWVLERPIQAKRTPWRQAYRDYAGLDPLCCEVDDWTSCALRMGFPVPEDALSWTRSDWWDYVMVCGIEPWLGKNGAEFLTDYPASQAALAELWTDSEGNRWARRFELYIDGVELCNGYQELLAPEEQQERFCLDLEQRAQLGKRLPTVDLHFLHALQSGLPVCSGVALGLDRLYMLALGKKEIREVLLFPDEIA